MPNTMDKYEWLEEVEGPKALEFAKAHNEKTLGHFRKNPMFKMVEKEARKIILDDAKLPSVTLINNELYNFWQDKNHVRGIWRKTTIASYKSKSPKWTTILDLDALAKKENENWVWHGQDFLEPSFSRTMIYLSRGGKDAHVMREFDMISKEFLPEGFSTPEAKSHSAWLDQNQILIGTDFGPGSLTESGYPRTIRLWKRGTPISEAKEVFQGEKTDTMAYAYVIRNPEKDYVIFHRSPSFFQSMTFYQNEKGEKIEMPFPKQSQFAGIFKNQALAELRADWGSFVKGSLIALDMDLLPLSQDEALKKVQLVFKPTDKLFRQGTQASRTQLIINVLDNVVYKIMSATKDGDTWNLKPYSKEESGTAYAYSADSMTDTFLWGHNSPTTPQSIYLGNTNGKSEILKSAPAYFNSKDIQVQRFSTKSKDGKVIPYWVIGKRKLKPEGENPTLLYGYGGFEIPITPSYMAVTGKVWLERGGVYVIANIRGGGEFGPAWHQSVLKENRPKVYQDFTAVAEDLIARKITKPEHLGISGRSNGGLLTGATFTLRPELFNAVISGVPLLDMLKYHKLLAGSSWVEEYGNPDDPKMREVLKSYSPYHNIKADVTYPEVLFMTSTKDDRVHPGHARKMVARMEEMGHKVYYYENMEGGHGGNANLEQKILWDTLEFTYLWEKLGLQP